MPTEDVPHSPFAMSGHRKLSHTLFLRPVRPNSTCQLSLHCLCGSMAGCALFSILPSTSWEGLHPGGSLLSLRAAEAPATVCVSTHFSHEACQRRRACCESCKLLWSKRGPQPTSTAERLPRMAASTISPHWGGRLRWFSRSCALHDAALGTCGAWCNLPLPAAGRQPCGATWPALRRAGHHHDPGVCLGPRLDDTLRSVLVRLRLQHGEHVTQLRLNAVNECIPRIVER